MNKELEHVLKILYDARQGDNMIYAFDANDWIPHTAIINYFSNIDDSKKVEVAKEIIEHCYALQHSLLSYLFKLLETREQSMFEKLKEREHEIENKTVKQMTFTAPEVVKISGKSKNTIYTHLKNGKLKGHNDGNGTWTVKREDLEKYLHRSNF